jgi:5-methylcytosine-specific restriction endonuclease McrA
MKNSIEQHTVLVLNRNWQAIGAKAPDDAFCMMAAGNATALDFKSDEEMSPVTWEQWLTLPVREGDASVGTVSRRIRIPKVLVLCRFDKVPKRRPKFCAKAIWERDAGVCQYTGRKLKPSEGNIDHILPLSRGGKTDWENCVLSDKKVNSKKGNRLPEEAGLTLIRRPFVPKEIPVTQLIKNIYQLKEWDLFLSVG